MTIHKKMTDKALEANRINGGKGNGPTDPSHSSQNARKLGLLSNKVVFQNDQERQEFDGLLSDLLEEYRPAGRTEVEMINKIAVDFWKLVVENGWEMRELAHRRLAAAAILRTLEEHYDGEQLPLFSERDGSHSAVQLGWDCQELVIRTGTRNSELESQGISKDRAGTEGHVHIEARLTTSLDTMLRYHAAINRDLYNALAELRCIQREKRQQRLPQDKRPINRRSQRKKGGIN